MPEPDALDVGETSTGERAPSEDWVFIEVPPTPGGGNGTFFIRFRDQPTLTESRQAKYSPETILHGIEGFNAYAGTEQRTFELEGRFFCDNEEEIHINNQILHVVRSLVMPDYNGTGAPPTPIRLHAYGRLNIHSLPCLVTQYSMVYPNDVDYVVSTNSTEKVIMPMVFTLSISLTEQHSVANLREFTLDKFRRGELVKEGF
jgi:hypothetical protein